MVGGCYVIDARMQRRITMALYHAAIVGLLFFLGVVQGEVTKAKCTMTPNPLMREDILDRVYGTVTFEEQAGEVRLSISLEGFDTENEHTMHGFHVHTGNDIEEACQNAGGHYNPTNKTHGGLESEIRHIGDLGNLEEDGQGKCERSLTDSVISLNGQYSVLGRMLDVHEKEDDLGLGNDTTSPINGNAGYRLACCIITEVEDDANAANSLVPATFGLVLSIFALWQ